MQQARAGQQGGPRMVTGIGVCECRTGPVIHHFTGALHRTGRQEVQTHAVTLHFTHAGHPYAMPPQLRHGMPAQRVAGYRADHLHIVAQAGQRDRNIGLGASHMDLQLRRLQQQFTTRRTQAQQQLTETNDAAHRFSLTRGWCSPTCADRWHRPCGGSPRRWDADGRG